MHDLLEILDALRDHIHAHVACKIDERLDDGRRIPVSTDGVDKHLVNLDDIDAELKHVGKTAVTGAHVVDRYANAETLKCGDCLPGLCEVLDRIALGNFKYDLGEFYRRIHKDVAHVFDDRRLAEKFSRKVE